MILKFSSIVEVEVDGCDVELESYRSSTTLSWELAVVECRDGVEKLEVLVPDQPVSFCVEFQNENGEGVVQNIDSEIRDARITDLCIKDGGGLFPSKLRVHIKNKQVVSSSVEF